MARHIHVKYAVVGQEAEYIDMSWGEACIPFCGDTYAELLAGFMLALQEHGVDIKPEKLYNVPQGDSKVLFTYYEIPDEQEQ